MQSVVGVAILADGRILAAQRAGPPEHAGRWEFPGGKVEADEEPAQAAVREVREELGCEVEVTGWLPAVVPIGAGLELSVCTARLLSGRPRPLEHGALAWLAPEEVADVAWLPADLPFVPLLVDVLDGAHR